ncbi:hypothetical protein C7H19_21205 [Aphanothece hegewaldii CCALA 016]|uniref:Sirohydrochlorin chelatase n=1 Tax=Aphanothece hegewaldii CCALA 016 TaxID=2107694 RepID=A0A2T1LSC7_9CHRO|nr:sirohydrochlorin chelatase [Aphanothece hegewaldii]PSF32650.1 hypothetical protein C7H19_21205 [Aphanothece hegewaldii CCALA 016]
MSSSAYLLVYHGSRDPRPEQAVRTLTNLFRQRITINESLVNVHHSINNVTALLTKPQYPLIDIASLELSAIPLHQNIIKFAKVASTLGFTKLQIIPLFLLPGVHVREDIPREITLAKSEIIETIQLELKSYLGASLELIPLLRQELEKDSADSSILLSHGSRYLGSNQAVEAIAYQLNAIPAYWSVAPSLETQLQVLIEQGAKKIAILPYFLFTGGITEAIAQQVQQLQQTYSQIQLYLREPIGPTEALAQIILNLL